MRFSPKEPPRRFEAGTDTKVTLSHCGDMHLGPDELISFVTDSGHEYDITRKEWGFYATPSLNHRLLQHNLHAVLARNGTNQFFLLLVENGKEAAFEAYLAAQHMTVVYWMDNTEQLERLSLNREVEGTAARETCPICGGTAWDTVFEYEQPPKGEVLAQRGNVAYHRVVIQCRICRHFLSSQTLDVGSLYRGEYVTSNYRDMDGIRKAFERIITLEPGQSDNVRRVARILDFSRQFLHRTSHSPSVLDVGSGIGVFPYAMKKAGWECTAVDPDERAVRHARENLGIRAVHGDFNSIESPGLFDVVTFNRVLEHVTDPIGMLRRSRDNVRPGGFVYVEVPDGEAAAREGKEREEFFIDHLHVFSFASLAITAQKAAYEICSEERAREPSGKYSLWAFLKPERVGADYE